MKLIMENSFFGSHDTSISILQSRLAITRLAIARFGYNAVGCGPRISAARGENGRYS